MAKTQEFDYYHGEGLDDFQFIRVPRQLMTDPHFRGLSSEAKLLYSLLLDRVSLSAKNGWWDEQRRVFIYFTIKEIGEIFSCSKNKAIWLLEELDTAKGVGLIERVRQGQGRPAKIYVKKFSTVENTNDLQESEVLTSQNEPSSGLNSKNQEVEKRNANYTERINQSIHQRKRNFETPDTGLMDGLIIPCADSKPSVTVRASTSFVKQMTLVRWACPLIPPCREYVSR